MKIGKRIIPLMLALIMAFMGAVPAFAEEEHNHEYEHAYEASSGSFVPTIIEGENPSPSIRVNQPEGEASTFAAVADSGWCGSNAKWELDINGVLTISGSGAMYDCVYTSDIPWYGYTGLVKKLVIREGITHIGNYSFYECIGFTGDIVIPDSVKTIGEGAFLNCTGFDGDIIIGDGVKTIGDGAFLNCYGLCGNLVIGKNVETIKYDAFYNCYNLTGNLIIPDSVTTIETEAFAYCESFDGTLSIGSGIKVIPDGAFACCFGLRGKLDIPYGVKSIGKSAFYGCFNLSGDLVIPGSVEFIGDGAFYACLSFSGDIVIPDGITSIGEATFATCGFDGTIIIPDSVKTIGESAFYGCDGLTENIYIPASVTSIDSYAFNCVFTDFIFEGDAPAIGEEVFTTSSILYYHEGTSGWNNSVWDNYDCQLYKEKGYVVRYNSNGGYGAPEGQEKTEGETMILSEKAPERKGYSFMGWAESPSAKTAEYDSGDYYYRDGDTTLYAVWKKIVRLSVNDINAQPGKTISVPVYIENDSVLSDIKVKISYDKSALSINDIKTGTIINMSKDISAGTVSGSCSAGNKALFTIEFRVSPSAQEKDYSVSLEITSCRDSYGNNLETEKTSGKISVSEVVKGDANGDSNLSSRDATLILRYLVGLVNESAIDKEASDYNGDGRVSSRDSTGILMALVSGGDCAHSYKSSITKNATCICEGTKKYTCENCGDTYYESIDFKEHTYSVASCTSGGICTGCKIATSEPTEHDLTTATCTAPPTCRKCGRVKGVFAPHDYAGGSCSKPEKCRVCGKEGELAPHDYKDATCTKPATCRDCGATTGSALGHDYVGVTCTKAGKCSRCGETKAATGHNYVSGKCTNCGAIDPDVLLTKEELFAIAELLSDAIEISQRAENSANRAYDYAQRGYYGAADTAISSAKSDARSAMNKMAQAYNIIGDFDYTYYINNNYYGLKDCLNRAYNCHYTAVNYSTSMTVGYYMVGSHIREGYYIWLYYAQTMIIHLLEEGIYV